MSAPVRAGAGRVPPPTPGFGSYPARDVTFLLTDLSGALLETPLEDREEAIQGGRHYSEMLPVEYEPTPEYARLFHATLERTAERVATAVGVVAERILGARGPDLVLASLARAGTPVGVLVRRWLAARHGLDVPHYSISIIRGRGLDGNAVDAICRAHPDAALQFVDGWTGKGAILRELVASCAASPHAARLDPTLAVLADPGACTTLYGTRDDFLVPSACLNATVSGLVSRTVLNSAVIGPGDYHGAKHYAELAPVDVSNLFVDTVTGRFERVAAEAERQAETLAADTTPPPWSGMRDVEAIQRRLGIDDANLIKPGVGETTRVLLRRIPWKVLVRPDRADDLGHLLLLAGDRQVPVVEWPDMTYSSCGVIRPLGRTAT